MDLIDIFKKHEGSFAVIDYKTPTGSVETAMGRLESVSKEGDIIITHLKDSRISWGFNISRVESHKFSPIKQDGGGE